jgi:short-subunit dehydrogenase
MSKILILGASSGIGRELARLAASQGHMVAIAARRENLLEEIKREFPKNIQIRRIDITDQDDTVNGIGELIAGIGGLDIAIISSGTGFINKELNIDPELETILTNVIGMTIAADCVMQYFFTRKSGHLVGISSIAALRGSGYAPAYNASKAFVSNYLEGLRQSAMKNGANIVITDVKPGFVDTAMAKGEGKFWVAAPAVAASQIWNAIRKKKEVVYVTRRWRFIAWLLKIIPLKLYKRL